MRKTIEILLVGFCMLVLDSLQAQTTSITGVIKSNTSELVVPFAAINFNNSKVGTIANEQGEFLLESYYAKDSILVSAVGYTSQKITNK